MIRKYWRAATIFAIFAAAVFFVVTWPKTIAVDRLAPRSADLVNGALVFNAGGCASCHATPQQDNRLMLGGGLALHSPFGTFHVPNISSDGTAGIGRWTEAQFASAMLYGTGRRGEHLYPAFPYTTYQRLTLTDVRDLYAYLKTVPAVTTASVPHDLVFPLNVRMLLGGWKLLFLDGKPFVADASKSAELNRGAYLTEALGHCAECHSGRNLLGGIKASERYAGGATPDGKGWVPNITPHANGLASWTTKDLVYFLETGTTAAGAPVEGEMAEVIKNLAQLSADDRKAMAAYLASLPPRPGSRPVKK